METMDLHEDLENLEIVEDYDINPPFPTQLEFYDIKTEYAKDENLKEADVKAVLDWVKTVPYLPKFIEFQAVAFLKRHNYNVESAQKALESYSNYKSDFKEMGDLYDITHPPMEGIMDLLLCSPLPQKSPEGYTIILTKILTPGLFPYQQTLILKLINMVALLNLYQEGTFNGHVVVFDMERYPYIFPPRSEIIPYIMFLTYWQTFSPSPLRGLHFLHPPDGMDDLVYMLKTGITRPLGPLLHVHKQLSDLTKHIPLACLPKEYGGLAESVEVLRENSKANVLKYDPFFDWEDELRIDVLKKPEDPDDLIDYVDDYKEKQPIEI